MVDSTTNTAALRSLVSVANSKIEPKLLTDTNYEILSIKPSRSATSGHNTTATLRIDLAANAPLAIVASDRYSQRSVEFTRIDLKDIATFRALEKNDKGQYIGQVTSAADAIALLNAAIEEDELLVVVAGDVTIVKAVETSLGYIGSLSFASTGEVVEPVDPEVPPLVAPELTALLIEGPETLEVEATSKYVAVASPADAKATPVQWSTTLGMIDESGMYLAPAEQGVAIITAQVGEIATSLTVTINPKG